MSLEKVVDGMRACATVALWKQAGNKVVATNGCFDILHAGHVEFLEEARRRGDKLVVGMNTDWSVEQLKGPTRPINTELARLTVLCGLASVDLVVLVPETDMCQFLEVVRPDLWVKGGDYTIKTLDQGEVEAARNVHAGIEIIPVLHEHSTTRLINRIKALA